MKIHHILISLAALTGISTNAQYIKWSNEAADTISINNILAKVATISDPGKRIATIAKEFIDTPYSAGTLESDGEEVLTVNLDKMDCTTLVDNVLAIAITAGEHRTSWRDFIYNLELIRYRGGEINGYTSRLHYISDWIVDNTHRGNFEEVTNRSDLVKYEIKTIDYMSTNRNSYPALADSATYAKIKETEIGFRSHRFPIIKTSRVDKAAKTFLRTGDIIAVCSNKKGLDVSHMGILFIDDKHIPYLLHASSKAGKVILDSVPLSRYLNQHRHTGIRVIRLKE